MVWVLGLMPLVLLLIGMPIFLTLLATSLTAIAFFSPVPNTVTVQVMYDSLNKFPLLAVPFFIFTGDLMSRGGISRRLLRWVDSLVGSWRASLPLTSLGFAAVFGAISGTTTASVAAVGSLTYPRMREEGYSDEFASALITAECALDNLIPPSIAFIIYGIATQTSVTALYAAGVLPGLVLGTIFAAYIIYYSNGLNVRKKAAFRFSEFVAATREGVWSFGAIFIVLGGIYLGVFSPTEAAGISSIYAIIVVRFVYNEASLEEIFSTAARAVFLTSLLFIIVAAAGLFAWLLTVAGVADWATQLIAHLQVPPWAVLLIINVFLLVIGCFLDPGTGLLVLSPLLLPIATSVGVDPIHFGVIVVMNLTIGTFHPPLGLNIFVFQAMFKTPTLVLYKGLIPFVLLAIFALMLITYIPAISLLLVPYLSR